MCPQFGEKLRAWFFSKGRRLKERRSHKVPPPGGGSTPEAPTAAKGRRDEVCPPKIIGNDERIQEIQRVIEKVADSDSTVILYGETGTGKELVARAIHQRSDRQTRPFVPVNCGAIPENLVESELFGHVRGAFTGATSSRAGKFEMADGGTVFLDEIGDMSTDLQVKLLRVLEEMEFVRVGGSRSIRVDVRVISATHRKLADCVDGGTFRRDLYYRLHVIPIRLPPLCERKRDIPRLLVYFLEEHEHRTGKRIGGFHEDAMEAMIQYSWPGNVRELRNLAERLVVLREHQQIKLEDLPERMRGPVKAMGVPGPDLTGDGICLSTAVTEFEKGLILRSLQKTNWVKTEAARLLQLNRTTLVEKIKRHRLAKEAQGS